MYLLDHALSFDTCWIQMFGNLTLAVGVLKKSIFLHQILLQTCIE
jgi:hypothetical protein